MTIWKKSLVTKPLDFSPTPAKALITSTFSADYVPPEPAIDTKTYDTSDYTQLLGGEALNERRDPQWGTENTATEWSRGWGSPRKGVHATYPASTPKYSTSNNDRSIQTMARLLVPLSGQREYEAFINSFGGQAAAGELAVPLGYYDGGSSYGYVDFLLTQAQESYQEKVQIVDVLSDNYVAFYFGSQPPVFQYSGVLLNTRQDDWRAAFTIMYNAIMRGSQLARRKKLLTLAYDEMSVTGSIMNMTQTLTAEMQMASQFTFQMLVQRIDVNRTRSSIPTGVLTPYPSVKPGEFAAVGHTFTVPPKTIRATGAPTFQTETRSDPAKATETPSSEQGSKPPNVFGGTIPDADRTAKPAPESVVRLRGR